jgi:glycosyltransferase involved in cell wall biosynthesis
MTRVDIITPVYNTRLEWVREAIESVRAQTLTAWRLLLVDDGSAPGYAAALSELVSSFADQRIVLLSRPNGGVSAARNTAIRATEAEYVSVLDADDVWYPNKLAIEVAALDLHGDIAIVHGNAHNLSPQGRVYGLRRTVSHFNSLTQTELLSLMLRRNIVGHCTFRRAALQAVRLYDEHLRTVEDKDLFLRLLLRGFKFFHVDETVYMYRVHIASSTWNVTAQLEGRLYLVEKMTQLVPGNVCAADLDWPRLKREMLRSAWTQAIEGYLERGDCRNAFELARRGAAGWSGHSLILLLRSIKGLVTPGLSPGQRHAGATPR